MSGYHEPILLAPARLFSSVGTCGTNAPGEVKKLQDLIRNAGYHSATGRNLAINGQCGQETIEAIKWYQRLLNLQPSGLVHPLDSAFMEALDNAKPYWRPKHLRGPLTVHQGQITFDAEGVDYVTAVEPFRQHRTPLFSRILHWPPVGRSGVTLGRGYDMGRRSTGEVFAVLRQAGLEEYKASLCSRAAGLTSHSAKYFVQIYGHLVGEITHRQQINLFDLTYYEKNSYARDVYNRNKNKRHGLVSWNDLDPKIKDVFVDTLYQGNRSASSMAMLMSEGATKQDIIRYLERSTEAGFDLRRKQLRIRSLM
jgi:hypothetical protein